MNHLNPRTHSSSTFIPPIKVFYFNASSVLPKLDKVNAICLTHSPHVICVVESWLSSDISNSKFSIPNYRSFRLDRNRHGGGLIVYVKLSLLASTVSKFSLSRSLTGTFSFIY